VHLDPAVLDKKGNRAPADLQKVTTIGYGKLLVKALTETIDAQGITIEGLGASDIKDMISDEAAAGLRNQVLADPDQIGQPIAVRVLANGRIDGYLKGRVTMASAARDGNVSVEQLKLTDALRDKGLIDISFNWGFVTAADASELRPEAAGLGVAILGSAYMMIVVLVLALPIGVAASIYLEEFAPKNRWTDLIEVNISNLAAVPSI